MDSVNRPYLENFLNKVDNISSVKIPYFEVKKATITEEYHREYYHKNKEERKEKKKEYYRKNRERINQYMREYRKIKKESNERS